MLNHFDVAKKYTDMGWALVAIPAGSKVPKTFGWQTKATPPEHWRDNPTHNMGLLHALSGTCSLDLDHMEHSRFIFEAMNIDLDAMLENYPRIVGNPERGKVLFRVPQGVELQTHKVNWPVEGELNKREVIFELRAGAVQDVLPPSIHPDTQKPYEWAGASYEDLPEVPQQLLTMWTEWLRFAPQLADLCPWRKVPEFKPKYKTRNLNGEMSVIDEFNKMHTLQGLYEKYGYVQYGNRFLSPNSTSKLPGAVIFEDGRGYSHHASDPFGEYGYDAFDFWMHFEHMGSVSAAVRDAADLLGLSSMPTAPSEEERAAIADGERILKGLRAKPEPVAEEVPSHLLTVPGRLGDLVKYANRVAIKSQPQFDVQIALAFGSIVMGQRWVTPMRNMSGLYFLNVGKTGEGKDNAHQVLLDVLRKASLEHLIGPSGYASENAVLTALREQPCHMTVIDEFGLNLSAANHTGSPHLQAANTRLLEVFGRQMGVIQSKAFSGNGLSRAQRKEQSTMIVNPSITLMGLTTPDSFYDALSGKDLASGFLNRFLIVESKRPRQRMRKLSRMVEPPEALLKWAVEHAHAQGDGAGNISDLGPELPPVPVAIDVTDEAMELFDQYEGEVTRRQEVMDAKASPLSALMNRNVEIAMRVSLIVSRSLELDEVTEEAARWAVDYVDFYNQQACSAFAQNVSEGITDKVRKKAAGAIREAGGAGIATRDLLRAVPALGNMNKMQRDGLFSVLEEDFPIQRHKQVIDGPGRPPVIFIWMTEN